MPNVLPLPVHDAPATAKPVPLLLSQPEAIDYLGTSRSKYLDLDAIIAYEERLAEERQHVLKALPDSVKRFMDNLKQETGDGRQ